MLPQPISESTAFLHESGVNVEDIRQTNLPSVGIFATPTLALVDRAGTVSSLWVGQLSHAQELEVWDSLRGHKTAQHDSGPTPDYLTEDQYEALRASGKPTVLLDIRERPQYATNHRPGTKDIPWDEIDTRGAIELSKSETIVVDCERIEALYCQGAEGALKRMGLASVSVLGGGSVTR